MIYELKETGRATALFAGWQDSVVWSALQGVMGKIYVDSLEKPESGVAMLGDFCFLSGKPESEVISGALANGASEEVILVPQNDDWAQMIVECYGEKSEKAIRYANVFPQDQVFTWKDAKHFHLGQYILMHSVIYRTQMLKNCGLELPQHTFYVDNIFVYYPLPYVKNLYYMNLDLYHYFIGRSDQSVNEQVMIGRVDQQIKVNKIMIDQYDLRTIQNPKLRKYMTSYLDIMMTVSSIMLIRSGTQESLDKKKDLWQYLKKKDAGLYYKLYFGIFGRAMNIPGKGGRKVSVFAYKLANKVMGFN